MLHLLKELLERGELTPAGTTPVKLMPLTPGSNHILGYGTSVPSAAADWNPGAIFIKTDGSNGTVLYINAGTNSSSSFKRIDEMAGLSTLTVAGLITASAGLTLPTGQTLTITDADKALIGGIIAPQHLELVYNVKPHASQVIHNIFNAPRGYTVTNISYTTNIAQAITATLVKSTVNATPASATTPLHTAGGINANTTIHNGTVVTLTATGADLILAATDKIGLVLSGAMATGDFTVNVSLKRS
ncbi:MAG: hypothetical protein WC100_03365 [Sterolibacterium sp.]